jgi:hypothetical protein
MEIEQHVSSSSAAPCGEALVEEANKSIEQNEAAVPWPAGESAQKSASGIDGKEESALSQMTEHPMAPEKKGRPRKKRKKIIFDDLDSDNSDDDTKVEDVTSDGPDHSKTEVKSDTGGEDSDLDDMAAAASNKNVKIEDSNPHKNVEIEDSNPQQRLFEFGGEGALCDVCFLAEGGASFVKCRECHLVVHSDCYFADGHMPIDEHGLFDCNACKALNGPKANRFGGKIKRNTQKDSTTPSPDPLSKYIEARSDGRNYPTPTGGSIGVDIFCQLCARRDVRGGMKATDTGKWVHLACMQTSKEAYNDSRGRVAGINIAIRRTKKELQEFERDTGNRAICEACLRSSAVLLRCPEDNCRVHLHPLCAEISNRVRVVTAVDNGSIFEFKCATHGHGGDARDAQCCVICGLGNKWSEMVGCEGCARWYHLSCLAPKLTEVPDGDWFCSDCHEVGRRMLSE